MDKQKVMTAQPEADVWSKHDDTPTAPNAVRIRIAGLRVIDAYEGIFEIPDVAVREIDWQAVARGLGREFLPDALASQIDNACFRYDVAEILSDRIERR